MEAAVKGASEQDDNICDFFTEKNHRTLQPRRNRMRDPVSTCEDANIMLNHVNIVN